MFGITLIKYEKDILVKGSLSRYRDFVYIDDVISIIIKSMMINDTRSIHLMFVHQKILVKNLIKNFLWKQK